MTWIVRIVATTLDQLHSFSLLCAGGVPLSVGFDVDDDFRSPRAHLCSPGNRFLGFALLEKRSLQERTTNCTKSQKINLNKGRVHQLQTQHFAAHTRTYYGE